jgi:hypothetical protein
LGTAILATREKKLTPISGTLGTGVCVDPSYLDL